MGARILPCGERGLLVELDDLDAALALNDLIATLIARGEQPWACLADVVPAARTVLLTAPDDDTAAHLRPQLHALLRGVGFADGIAPRATRQSGRRVVEIEVHYDGPDLDAVAQLTGLSVADVIAAHTGRTWQVAFGGFAPGFFYLAGGDPRLDVPRRSEPRTAVPVGAVGLAGPFSGIYPRSSPGGWQLLGHTDAVLWDTDRTPPALLNPGWTVRFVAVEAT